MQHIKISFNDNNRLLSLFNGLKYAVEDEANDELIQTDSFTQLEKKEIIESPIQSSGSNCLTCKCDLGARDQQVQHYRSDWHRYNLKLRLLGQLAVGEEQFADLEDALSISGSETEDDDDSSEEVTEVSTSILKPDYNENVKFYDDRRPKFYLKNIDDEIISIYKKVLCNKQADLIDSNLTSRIQHVLETVQTSFWFIALFNAGHFAAAVFDASANVLTHKTFHRYIVRAKRGTVQSINDNSSRGHAAKSAGASLRRLNEAALEESIKSLIKSWKEDYLDKCSHIFLRIPHYRKSLFYGGKDPLFDHTDQRIRSIPFVTRRPTFNEVKRVHKELFSITLHGKTNLSDLLSNSKAKQPTEEPTQQERNEETYFELTKTEENDSEFAKEKDLVLEESNVIEEIDTLNIRPKKKKKLKDKAPVSVPAEKPVEAENSDDSVHLTVLEQKCIEKLYTACKTSNIEMLEKILEFDFVEIAANSTKNTETCDSLTINDEKNADSCGNSSSDVPELKKRLLSHPLDKSGDTLLHVAAREGGKHVILKLLENGSDPTARNSSFMPPYCVCSNKEAKNTFRRFRAKFPDKYDYSKAQVASALSEEMEAENKKRQAEKKKAQKAAKREREKKQKEEEEKRLEERTEKERFLALSDREKRLIAVERRLQNQPHVQLSQAKRCYSCAESLFAKVPFEYLDFKFCSITCLKEHKSKTKK